MLGITSSIASLLSRYYRSNNEALAVSLARVASGKRFQTAGDDITGFIRATQLHLDAGLYDDMARALAGSRGYVDYAVETGSVVVEDLTGMRSLAQQYEATSDPDERASLKARFDALRGKIDTLVANARYNGVQVYAAGVLLTIQVDPRGATIDLVISDTADTAAIGPIDDYPDVVDNLDAQILAGATYLAQASAYADQIAVFSGLSQTGAAGKRLHADAITGINELEELARITDIQVRQQALVAMAAQAHLSRSALSGLYSVNQTLFR